MSKKKKKTKTAELSEPAVEKDVIEYKESHTMLVRLMKDTGIKRVQISYSGSGDSGGVDSIEYQDEEGNVISLGTNKELDECIENVTYELTSADFNNDGSAGELTFQLSKEGKLFVKGTHQEFYQSSNDTSFDHELLDENKVL